MRLSLSRLGARLALVMGDDGSLPDRIAADRRRARYSNALGLRYDAACLLDQLALAKGRLVHLRDAAKYVGRHGRVVELRPRTPEICMIEIRARLGADAIETVHEISWRLSPLGRLRAMRAQGFALSTLAGEQQE